MNDSFPVNTSLDFKVDLTQSTEDITGIAKDTHKGLGKLMYALCGPMMEKRIGQAKRIAAQADKDCLDIMEGRKRFDGTSSLTVPIKETSTVEALCTELINKESECKAKRLLAAIMHAAQEIKIIPPDEIADEPINQTLFNHWRTEAELIDEDYLRRFWAHLLVEEIKKPNSISPRTLDIAKNLSREEAEAFVRIIPGIVDNAVIVNGTGHPLWGKYSEMLALQDARLVGSQSSSVTYSANAENPQHSKIVLLPFLDSELALIVEKDKISISVNVLTTAGREIYCIVKTPLSLEQIIKIANAISQQNQNAIVSILPAKIISTESNGEVKYQCSCSPLWSNRPKSSASDGVTK